MTRVERVSISSNILHFHSALLTEIKLPILSLENCLIVIVQW